jgi:hypothetical protein
MAADASTFEFGKEGFSGDPDRIYLLAQAVKSENLKIKLP